MKVKMLTGALILTSALLIFTSCNSNKIDEYVTVNNVNQSSVNIAEGFFQSVFTDDEELFEACFPESFKDYEDSNGNTLDMHELFEGYTLSVTSEYTYLGASVSAYNDYDAEHGYDFPSIRNDISVLHHMEEDLVESASIVKLRLFFTTDGKDKVTTDVYILVYKSEQAWYVFELQNSDAEFAV